MIAYGRVFKPARPSTEGPVCLVGAPEGTPLHVIFRQPLKNDQGEAFKNDMVRGDCHAPTASGLAKAKGGGSSQRGAVTAMPRLHRGW